jgi:hypothetical protein
VVYRVIEILQMDANTWMHGYAEILIQMKLTQIDFVESQTMLVRGNAIDVEDHRLLRQLII